MRNRMIPVTEARDRMKEILGMAEEGPVTLIRRSRPAAVIIGADRYEALLDRLEDLEAQCSVLYSELHPDEAEDWDDLKNELELDDDEENLAARVDVTTGQPVIREGPAKERHAATG